MSTPLPMTTQWDCLLEQLKDESERKVYYLFISIYSFLKRMHFFTFYTYNLLTMYTVMYVHQP